MKIYLSAELTKALPKPGDGQSEKEFISSCMSNEKMVDEFPDKDQRVAVCYSQWKGPEKVKKSITLGGLFKAWSEAAREAAAAARRASTGKVEETTAELYANRPSRRQQKVVADRSYDPKFAEFDRENALSVTSSTSDKPRAELDWRQRGRLRSLVEGVPFQRKPKEESEAKVRRRKSYLDKPYYQRQLSERVARDTKSLTGMFKAWSPEARAAAAEARRGRGTSGARRGGSTEDYTASMAKDRALLARAKTPEDFGKVARMARDTATRARSFYDMKEMEYHTASGTDRPAARKAMYAAAKVRDQAHTALYLVDDANRKASLGTAKTLSDAEKKLKRDYVDKRLTRK